MVPNDWSLVEAKDVCKAISVGVVIKPTQYYVSKDEGIKAFRSANVREGFINDNDWVYFSKEGHAANKKSSLLAGDVLIVRTGYPGTACVVTPEFEGSNAIDIVIARPDSNKIIPEYLCAYTNSHIGKSQVLDLQGGLAQKHLNVGAYQVLKIKLPPLLEQNKITKILATWDKAISTTEQLLANSQQHKKALMQQLLTGKKRLLDNNGVRFSGAWNLFSLKSICEFIKDGTHGTHIRYESGVPLLSAINITKEGQIDFDGAPFISNEDYEKIHSKYQISMGDILITVVGTLGRVALVETDSKFTLQRSVAILRIKENISNKFMKQIFSAPEFTETLVKKSNSTAQAGVYLGELAKICIRIPEFEEQQKIAAVLSTADKEISALQQKLDALKQEKKALMQQLLTGKRRVTVN
ncbi:restriction endonuclease subunit S [Aeromonas veronii]